MSEAAAPKKPGFAGHAVTYAIGNVARQIVGFLMLPIYTRYLAPADYGAVGLLGFALALLEPFFGARLATAVPKFYFDAKSEDSRRAVLSSAIILTGGVSAITAALIAIFRHPASQALFGTQDYALATALFGINMLTQPVEYTGMMYLRLLERSRLFLAISLGKMMLQIVLNLWLVVHLKQGVIGVILSGVIASTATSAGLTAYVFFQSRPKFEFATTWRMLAFCWPLWFAGLAGLYIGSSNRLYLRVFESLGDVGLLELGSKFASIVSLLLWAPFGQHWETVSFRYHSEGRGAQIFPAAFIIISTLMLSAGLGVSIFAEPVINVMSDPAFHGAARTVPLLTLGLLLNNLVIFFYFSFFVTQNTRIYSYCHYLTAGIITVAYISLIPLWGLMGSVAAQCLAYAANFMFVWHWSRKYYDPGIRLGGIAIVLVIATCGYLCANVLLHLPNTIEDLAWKLAVYAAAMACMFAFMLKEVKRLNYEIYAEIKSLAHRFRMGALVR